VKKKLIGIILLSILLSSCTKDEKKLASVFDSIKKSRFELVENQNFPNLIEDTLILLKSYSDSLDEGNELLNKLMKKSSSKKKIRKYLSKTQGLESICSEFFFKNEVLETIKNQCKLDFFDICPISFSRYQQNNKEMINNLENILGESFNRTDCHEYLNEELSNEKK
jgi:hypothetical protein